MDASQLPGRVGFSPTSSTDRIELLDAIRGVALGGILLANLMSFMGSDMIDAAARRTMMAGEMGERVLFSINWLVEGKFYSVFSILFGVGFYLQSASARRHGVEPARFDRFFRRRMLVLTGIGLFHMYVLWAGDILTLYGLMGLLLPSLARIPPRARTLSMLALLAVPVATHVVVLASDGRLDPRPPFATAGASLKRSFGHAERSTLDVFARGSSVDYAKWNVAYAVVRPGTYLQSGRPAKVLGLFLLGAFIGSTLPRWDRVRARHLALAAVSLGSVGLVASWMYAAIKAETGSTFLLSGLGVLQTTAYSLGTTPLAIAYLLAAALAWRTGVGRRCLAWFAPLGRMALTAYLTQTLTQVSHFTGVGLGLCARVPIAALPFIAAVLLVLQRRACVWWLQRHAHGPAEWLWRAGTYGQSSAAASA